jgi:hypothetical protein
MSNPYAAVNESASRSVQRAGLRFVPALVSWLIGLAFLGHGMLLAGEYFANNGFGPPTKIAKSVLIAVITAPIAVSALSFLTGCTWIAYSRYAVRWTILMSVAIVSYVGYFLWLIL